MSEASITCSGCTETWTALGACHCANCHHTFASVSLFDKHRSAAGDRGHCLNPANLRNDKTSEPLCEYRDGMWRYPEMDEATKLARFGTRT